MSGHRLKKAMHPTGRAILGAALLVLGVSRTVPAATTDTTLLSVQGPTGVTSLSGQVLDENGQGLAQVLLLVGASQTWTATTGRFLLAPIPPGKIVLQIDGRHAGTKHNEDHGFYEVRVDAKPGQTTGLPFKSWLPLIDHQHEVTLTSPTRAPVVVRSASVPGLELHIPAGVVVRDVDGQAVTRIGITTMPKDHTPFPLPKDFDLPVFYTIQPGAACLYNQAGAPGTASIYYPNSTHELPKARATFWRYEPDANGWTAHGTGTVSADASQVVPDEDTYITDFGSAECTPTTRTRQKRLERPDPRLLRRLAR